MFNVVFLYCISFSGQDVAMFFLWFIIDAIMIVFLFQVKKLMVHYMGKEGAYIIRNSFSKPGSYTVSVM